MFGNLQGWAIAAVFAALIGWRTMSLVQVPGPTRPTGFPQLLDPVQLPPGHEAVVKPGTEPGDAGPLYLEAANHYRRAPGKYRSWRGAPKLDKLGELQGVDLILQGAQKESMTLFRDKPQEVLNYQGSSETVDALKELGGVFDTIGTVHRRVTKDYDQAERYFGAVFAMGRHLFNERVGFEELSAGGALMDKSAEALKLTAQDRGDAARAAEIEKWQSEYRAYMGRRVTPVARFLRGVDNQGGRVDMTVAPHAGDTFLLARESKEPMWRAEAILKMGRLRYNAATKGDQVTAKRELPNYLNERHPAVKAAADAANKLTVDEYRMIH